MSSAIFRSYQHVINYDQQNRPITTDFVNPITSFSQCIIFAGFMVERLERPELKDGKTEGGTKGRIEGGRKYNFNGCIVLRNDFFTVAGYTPRESFDRYAGLKYSLNPSVPYVRRRRNEEPVRNYFSVLKRFSRDIIKFY